jgi:hypothetical protein
MTMVDTNSGARGAAHPAKILRRWTRPLVLAGVVVAAGATAVLLHVSPLSTHRLKTPLNSGAAITYSALPGSKDVVGLLAGNAAPRRSAVVAGTLLQAGFSSLSAHVLREALSKDEANISLHAALGEALVLANGGRIVPEAKAEFDRVLAANPNDLVSRFYMAYWLLQNGKPKPALVKWVGLMRTVGADRLWYDRLWEAMPLAAEQVGVDRLALQALCTAGM